MFTNIGPALRIIATTSLVSVVPPANVPEPMVLVAKLPPEKPLEMQANVPWNTTVKVMAEV